MNVPASIAALLRCPRCRGPLVAQPLQGRDRGAERPRQGCGGPPELHAEAESPALRCAGCTREYPVVDGMPILIDAERSVFTPSAIIEDFERARAQPPRSMLRTLAWTIASWTPHLPSHRRQRTIARRFAERLAAVRTAPVVLVVGSGAEGIGVDAVRAIPGATICEFDVYLTAARMLVADLLDLPFESGSFDAVVAQGVLEHVIDPPRAVEEIHRVLKPEGLVFSTTPFVLGVHLPVADYTRFSRLALIRLFRRFTPLDCDVVEGAAVTLAYSLAYFWMALWSSFGWRAGAKVAKYAGNYLIFWLRYLDALVRRSPISVDAAASYYYIGRRSEATLADRDIVKMFTGVGLCPW